MKNPSAEWLVHIYSFTYRIEKLSTEFGREVDKHISVE